MQRGHRPKGRRLVKGSGDERQVCVGSLVDTALIAELELATILMIAANESDRHLTPGEVDALLDLPPIQPAHMAPQAGIDPGSLRSRES
jgi:hypothetical protein